MTAHVKHNGNSTYVTVGDVEVELYGKGTYGEHRHIQLGNDQYDVTDLDAMIEALEATRTHLRGHVAGNGIGDNA